MLLRCIRDGRPGYRWGDGEVFAYDVGDRDGRVRALHLAQASRYAPKLDADSAMKWRLAEPQAPSSRALERVLSSWVRRLMQPVYRDLSAALDEWRGRRPDADSIEADDAGLSPVEAEQLLAMLRRRARMMVARMDDGPPMAAIEAALDRAARKSAAATRRHLVDLGASRDELASRYGMPAGDLLRIDAPLTPKEQIAWREWVDGRAVRSPSGTRETGLAKIVRLPQEAVRGLEKKLVPDFLQGRRPETIAKELQSLLGVDARHARLLARDQIGKLNGHIAEETQAEAGIEEYRWISSRDERVRDLHADLHGFIFRWDDPPESGTNGERLPPGMPIQCRCFADPILPDVLIPAEPARLAA